MSIEKDVDFQFKWILDKIKTNHLLAPKGKLAEYVISYSQNEGNSPSPEAQRKIISKLESLEVIKIQENKYDPSTNVVPKAFIEMAEEMGRIKPIGFILEIIQPNFNELWSEYENKCRNYVEKSGSAFPDLPHNNNWQNITIYFLNGEEVFIEVMKKRVHADYKLMGFENKKNKRPNKQWLLLRLLSEKGGKLSWENNSDLSLRKINNMAKQKELLSKTLKKCFGINKAPFYSYKKERAYEIKLNLVPERKD